MPKIINASTSSAVLKITKLQKYGLLSRAAIFDTERRLAKKLRRDALKSLNDSEIAKLQNLRSNNLYQIRKKLEHCTNQRVNLRSITDLETTGIKTMRKLDKQLITQLKNISKTIIDSHNLIIYEEQQVIHDLATVITCLSHFIHIIELNLEHNGISEYIPINFQLRLKLLIDEAHNQLIYIEEQAKKCLLNQFEIHQFLLRRGQQNVFTSKDLASLIVSKSIQNNNLHFKINGVKKLIHQINSILIDVKEFHKTDQLGIFLPQISMITNHANVEIQLFAEHLKDLVNKWPIDESKRLSILNNSQKIIIQLKLIKQKLSNQSNKQKTQLKQNQHILVDLQSKIMHQPINETIKIIKLITEQLSNYSTDPKIQASVYRVINDYLNNQQPKIIKYLTYVSKLNMDVKMSKEQKARKDHLFKIFLGTLKKFESKMDFFYSQIQTRLSNATDIIKNSLLLQQHLAIELNFLKKYVEELYRTLKRSHHNIANQLKSDYKKQQHNRFAIQISEKELELQNEINTLKNTIGKSISHLIKDIPEDESLESTMSQAAANKISSQGHQISHQLEILSNLIETLPHQN